MEALNGRKHFGSTFQRDQLLSVRVLSPAGRKLKFHVTQRAQL
jgi:hypothetical protein